jgi:putative ABC transport system permease protein
MPDLFGDCRYAFRLLFRNPGVTVVAILALALGIGANTAIFSVVHAVLLRPLPIRQPDQVVSLRIDHAQRNIRNALGPYSDIVEWRKQARSFEAMSAYSSGSANLITGQEPERVPLWRVNANFFPLLGVKMAAGRDFRQEEDRPGAAPVAILSYSLWQRRFGSAPDTLGRPILLDGAAYTVVGILPRDFRIEDRPPDIYAPLAMSDTRPPGESFNCASYARLRPGVSIEQAQAEMETVSSRVEEASRRPLRGFRAHVWGMRDFMVRDVRRSLVVLLTAVALVLLIACANIANLLLARAGARGKEIAIRAAMGAPRWRIVRQLLTESVLLASIGAVLGVLLAYWGVAAITAIGTNAYPMLKESRLDLPVLGFTVVVAVLTGLLFGLAPALAASRTDLQDTLKEGGRGSSIAAKNRLRNLLVVSEVALALLLMVGASLMIRSLMKLQDIEPGFNPEGVLTASVNLPPAKYSTPPQQLAFYQRVEERLNGVPGVIAAGFTSHLPLGGVNSGMPMVIQGRPISGPADAPILWYRFVTPGYFQAMRIPLRRGRAFDSRDVAGAQRVAVVNETTARRFWPNQDPIGKRVGNGAPDGWIPIVGVVADVRHMSLTRDPDPEIYFAFAQGPRTAMILTVRTAGDPLRFAPALRRAVMEVDADQPLARIASMDQNLSDSLAAKRVSTVLLGIFAGLALLLASIGIYGVISFSVTCRKHEIGVRMALGARAGDVLRMIVLRGTVLALIGVAVGLAASLVLTRLIESMLFRVKATDPLVYASVALLLTAVAALASYIPARRAARVDPTVALRYE